MRAEADSNRGPSAYQPNALPLGQTALRRIRHILARERQGISVVCVLWDNLTSAPTASKMSQVSNAAAVGSGCFQGPEMCRFYTANYYYYYYGIISGSTELLLLIILLSSLVRRLLNVGDVV